jgi:hypothetical protein
VRRRGAGVTPLPYVFDADAIIALVSGDAAMRDALLPLLPAGQQTLPHLVETLRSPQLRQALMSLTGALDTENSAAIFSNFGLNAADGDAQMAAGDAVGALAAAIQAQADRQRAAQGQGQGQSGQQGGNSSGGGSTGGGSASGGQ